MEELEVIMDYEALLINQLDIIRNCLNNNDAKGVMKAIDVLYLFWERWATKKTKELKKNAETYEDYINLLTAIISEMDKKIKGGLLGRRRIGSL